MRRLARSWPGAAGSGTIPSGCWSADRIETRAPIATIDQVRRLSSASPAERVVRQAVFFHPAIAIRSGIGQGVHDRCEAYVFGRRDC